MLNEWLERLLQSIEAGLAFSQAIEQQGNISLNKNLTNSS